MIVQFQEIVGSIKQERGLLKIYHKMFLIFSYYLKESNSFKSFFSDGFINSYYV